MTLSMVTLTIALVVSVMVIDRGYNTMLYILVVHSMSVIVLAMEMFKLGNAEAQVQVRAAE